MKSTDLLKECTPEEAREIAAQSINVPVEEVKLVGSTDSIYVFSAEITERRKTRNAVRVVDKKGFIKVQRGNAVIVPTNAREVSARLSEVWDDGCVYTGDTVIYPDIFMAIGGHVIDLSGMLNKEQAETVASTELNGLNPEEPVILIVAL